jgi:chromosomal replication initiation ATPase DnaA
MSYVDTSDLWKAPVLELITEVAEEHGFTLAEILSDDRPRDLSRVRHEAMRRAKARFPRELYPHMTYRALGDIFNKDHKAVFKACKKGPDA